MENIQTGLDVAGMAPVVGEIADGFNAAIYLMQGKYVESGLSFAAMIPGLGIFSVSGRLGKKFLNFGESVLEDAKQIERLAELGDIITDANGVVKKTISPVEATENAGKGFALRTKTDAIQEHILNGELDAARREAAGEIVARKANGNPYDHVKELRDAQNGLLNRIQNIKKSLGNPNLDIGTRIALEQELSQASKLLDKTEEFLPR